MNDASSQDYTAQIEQILLLKQENRFVEMRAAAEATIAWFNKKVDGHRLLGESLIMIAQYQEADLGRALELVQHGINSLRKAMSLCSSQQERKKEKELDKQLLKARKVEQQKQHEKTRNEKLDLLQCLKNAMENYMELIKKHSTKSAQTEKPMELVEYFDEKWKKNDPAFQKLEVPEYLLNPLQPNQMFEEPTVLSCGCTFERSQLPANMTHCPDPAMNCLLEDPNLLVVDFQLKAACQHFIDENPWSFEYNINGSGYKKEVLM